MTKAFPVGWSGFFACCQFLLKVLLLLHLFIILLSVYQLKICLLVEVFDISWFFFVVNFKVYLYTWWTEFVEWFFWLFLFVDFKEVLLFINVTEVFNILMKMIFNRAQISCGIIFRPVFWILLFFVLFILLEPNIVLFHLIDISKYKLFVYAIILVKLIKLNTI